MYASHLSVVSDTLIYSTGTSINFLSSVLSTQDTQIASKLSSWQVTLQLTPLQGRSWTTGAWRTSVFAYMLLVCSVDGFRGLHSHQQCTGFLQPISHPHLMLSGSLLFVSLKGILQLFYFAHYLKADESEYFSICLLPFGSLWHSLTAYILCPSFYWRFMSFHFLCAEFPQS